MFNLFNYRNQKQNLMLLKKRKWQIRQKNQIQKKSMMKKNYRVYKNQAI